MRTTDALWESLRGRLGGDFDDAPRRDPARVRGEVAAQVEGLRGMLALCEPRLIIGGIRYASTWTHPGLVDYIAEKVRRYRAAGDFENLVEGVLRTHPRHHFEGDDR